MWPFKKKHKHRWKHYSKITTDKRTIFYCRKCECGLDQVQSAGPTGDMGWRDTSMPMRTDWEQEWFDNAIVQVR